jgi:hypothetical protein
MSNLLIGIGYRHHWRTHDTRNQALLRACEQAPLAKSGLLAACPVQTAYTSFALFLRGVPLCEQGP